jgi:acyl-CoA synthetase (AMP-forming)/AMP-acid ligase II
MFASDPAMRVAAAMESSIPARLVELATRHPTRRAFGFISRHAEQFLTWSEVARRAHTIARALIEHGTAPGTRVGMIAASTPEFVSNVFGVLCAGATPVTLPTVATVGRNMGGERHHRMLVNAGAGVLLAAPEDQALARQLAGAGVRILDSAALLSSAPTSDVALPRVSADDLALLQPTSGSTAFPRAVAVRGRHVFATCAAMAVHLGMAGLPGTDGAEDAEPREALVSWLPLYHDMGLIISLFMAALLGAPSYIIAPMTFLLRPAVWLQTISRFRGTLSAAPNFGYAHATRKIRDAEVEGLDLSSWRHAVLGAEPVLPATCQAFADRFRPAGFTEAALVPGYGLAENTLAVSMAAPGRPRLAAPAEPGNSSFVDCGRPLPGTELRVVDMAGQVAPDGVVGQIELRGLSLMAGYVQHGGEPALPLHDTWFATGDLGFLRDGALYVTGRLKELIIRGGRNLYPHELESAAARALGDEQPEIVAVGVPDPELGSERIVLLVEMPSRGPERDDQIIMAIKNEVYTQLEAVPDEVVLVPPRTILRTTSGKLMRVSAREHYLATRLDRGATQGDVATPGAPAQAGAGSTP